VRIAPNGRVAVTMSYVEMGQGTYTSIPMPIAEELEAEAGWGQPLPAGQGRGVSLQFAFGTYMAQIAEVEVAKDGSVAVKRVVCAVDAGVIVNPDTVQAQIQSAVIFGISGVLYGQATLKDGRIEQSNFHV
jgi:isoquinoline 1-oxidoreductase beta subunit